MDDSKGMLRKILNGQSAMKSELLTKIDKVDKKVDALGTGLKSEIKRVEKNLTERIDKIGLQVAKLEDDAPTNEEFDKLEERVTNLENTVFTPA